MAKITLTIPDAIMAEIEKSGLKNNMSIRDIVVAFLKLGLVTDSFGEGPDGVYVHIGNKVTKIVLSKEE